MELTKAEKKSVRILLDKALKQDYLNGIEKVRGVIGQWDLQEQKDPRSTYLQLYRTLSDHDKQIGKKFDGLSGAHYFTCLLMCHHEGLLQKTDLDILPDHLKEKVIFWNRG